MTQNPTSNPGATPEAQWQAARAVGPRPQHDAGAAPQSAANPAPQFSAGGHRSPAEALLRPNPPLVLARSTREVPYLTRPTGLARSTARGSRLLRVRLARRRRLRGLGRAAGGRAMWCWLEQVHCLRCWRSLVAWRLATRGTALRRSRTSSAAPAVVASASFPGQGNGQGTTGQGNTGQGQGTLPGQGRAGCAVQGSTGQGSTGAGHASRATKAGHPARHRYAERLSPHPLTLAKAAPAGGERTLGPPGTARRPTPPSARGNHLGGRRWLMGAQGGLGVSTKWNGLPRRRIATREDGSPGGGVG